MTTAQDVIKKLKLQPHPTEGGYFIETYRSKETMTNDIHGTRNVSTAIYYMLTDEENSFSEMHLLDIDELFHFFTSIPRHEWRAPTAAGLHFRIHL